MAAEGQKTLEAFFARYGITYDRDRSTIELMRLFSEYDKMKALRERVDGRKENQRKAEEIEKRIIAFFDKYNIKIDCSYEDAIDRIQEKITKFEAAEQEFLNARKSKTLFASQHDVEALLKKKRPEFPESMEELTRAFDETDKNRRENEQRKRENISRMEALEERAETLAGNSEELSDALEKRAELRKKVEIYRKTETLLGRAKSSLQEKTADPLTKRFRENLSVILDRETDDFSLDGDGLAVEEVNESFRSAKLLSGGTRALVYFALRLAIADVAYPEEKPILIMDDPFQPLDREKTERALKLLEKTSERYQILYFTCHESRTVLK